jgi:hypothetical protein
VQLVRQPGSEPAERPQTLVVKLLRPAEPRAIDHLVDQRGGQLGALSDQLGEMRAVQREKRGALFDGKPADRRPPARIRYGAMHSARPRLGRPAPDSALVAIERPRPGHYNEQLVDRRPDVQHDRVGGACTYLPASDQPLELIARDIREKRECHEAVDDVNGVHSAGQIG